MIGLLLLLGFYLSLWKIDRLTDHGHCIYDELPPMPRIWTLAYQDRGDIYVTRRSR